MVSKAELLEEMKKVLDNSEWDNLSMNLETDQVVEFANFESGEILYNMGRISNKKHVDELEQNFEFETVVKEEDNLILSRDTNEDIEKYLNEIQEILEILDSSRDNIASIEVKNIT